MMRIIRSLIVAAVFVGAAGPAAGEGPDNTPIEQAKPSTGIDFFVDILWGSATAKNASAQAQVSGPPCFLFC